jgi:hypothetical protein
MKKIIAGIAQFVYSPGKGRGRGVLGNVYRVDQSMSTTHFSNIDFAPFLQLQNISMYLKNSFN